MAPSVGEYYAGKNVLITGATGFVGKILVEKLLRSCPEVNTIYLLLRQKKGMSSEERLRDLISNKLFNPLRAKQPDVFNKLRLVAGDILEDELGLSNDDRQELQRRCHVVFHSAACVRGDILDDELGLNNDDRQELQRRCHGVFHSAACVRFDQKLKDAVNLNTTGTLRVLKLAEKMENIEVLVHISTAYCRCELDVLEEKLYPAVHKPARIMDIVDWMDDGMLDYLEPKLIAPEPNTYAYTKAITEDMVAEYGKKFPVAIARPSIVVASLKEPIPGWVDNLNGPTGLIIGSGKGVIRTMHCEPSYLADAMPVDVVVNACILLAFATAIERPQEAKFFNVTMSGALRCTWGEMIRLGEYWVNMYPPTIALWYPGGSIKSYWLWHQFCLVTTQLIPAYLIDAFLFLLGKKTFMVKVQERISHGLDVLQYYTTKEWHFRNTNFTALRSKVSEADNETFFTDVSKVDVNDYLKNYMIGAREYCCKEDPANLERARKLHNIRYYVDRVTRCILIFLLCWFLYSYAHVFTAAIEYLDVSLKNISPY